MSGLPLQKPRSSGWRICLYGVGGIGKTSLALLAPGPRVVIDLDDSVGRIAPDEPVLYPTSWADMLGLLRQTDSWAGVQTIIIDSLSVAEDMALKHVLTSVRTDKGQSAKRIEDYGYGKGYRFLYDEFLPLFEALDRHRLAGRTVILVAHSITANVPNPQGDDYIRYEPRLMGVEKHSIRLRLKEWVDQLWFLGYDVDVRAAKARGSGSRTIWTQEMPHCLAKCRASAGLEIPASFEFAAGSDAAWKYLGLNAPTTAVRPPMPKP